MVDVDIPWQANLHKPGEPELGFARLFVLQSDGAILHLHRLEVRNE